MRRQQQLMYFTINVSMYTNIQQLQAGRRIGSRASDPLSPSNCNGTDYSQFSLGGKVSLKGRL